MAIHVFWGHYCPKSGNPHKNLHTVKIHWRNTPKSPVVGIISSLIHSLGEFAIKMVDMARNVIFGTFIALKSENSHKTSMTVKIQTENFPKVLLREQHQD